jgi:hypothetical protein
MSWQTLETVEQMFQSVVGWETPVDCQLNKFTRAQPWFTILFTHVVFLQNTRWTSFQDNHCGHQITSLAMV